MKQKNKIIIASSVIALIIIAGIVAVYMWGFNKELRFSQTQKIDIYVEQKVDKNKIKEITNEVLGMHNMVQTIEIYEDMVTIRAISISEQQRNSIVNKVKENYEFEQTAEKTEIDTIPATRFRDIYKQYVIPFVISVVLIVAYMAIRYYKKGLLKVILKTVLIPVIAELLLLSWMAIVRIPVGIFTPTFIILVYAASIWLVIKEIEK